MTKLKHVAFAGITALAFSQIAFAGGDKQNQSGMSRAERRQTASSRAPRRAWSRAPSSRRRKS